VSSDHRVRRLRELLAQIEKLPVTSERERMLREIRARVVDVDTGMATSAMLPVDPVPALAMATGSSTAHAPKPVARSRADHDRGRPAGSPPERRRSVEAARPEAGSRSGARGTGVGLSAAQDREWLALVATNEVLSLDDSASLPSAGQPRSGHDSRPWTRGLRG
jgi:hypothetical protein